MGVLPIDFAGVVAELETLSVGLPQPAFGHLQRAIVFLRAARDGANVDAGELIRQEQRASLRLVS